MMDLGINSGMLVLQLINVALFVVVPGVAILALLSLFRNQPESDTAVAVWVLIILIVPVLGPIAYFMSRSIRPAPER